MARSPHPEAVPAASQRVSELVEAGVVLSSTGDFGSGRATFVFTRLNGLKPAMIAAACSTSCAERDGGSRLDQGLNFSVPGAGFHGWSGSK
jgi:hypothetical protein